MAPGAEGLLANFVFIRPSKWARCHRHYHRQTDIRRCGYRRIYSGLGVPICLLCLGVSLFKFSVISSLDADHLRYVSFTGTCHSLACVHRHHGPHFSLIAPQRSGRTASTGRCRGLWRLQPQCIFFRLRKTPRPPCPFSLTLLVLTLPRSSLVVAPLAWHWQQD